MASADARLLLVLRKFAAMATCKEEPRTPNAWLEEECVCAELGMPLESVEMCFESLRSASVLETVDGMSISVEEDSRAAMDCECCDAQDFRIGIWC